MDSRHWQFASVNDNFTKTHQVPLAQALEHFKAMGVIPKMSIPSVQVLRHSKMDFIVEEYQNFNGDKAQQYFIEIVTPEGKTHKINIIDVNFCHNLKFEATWEHDLMGDGFKIGDPVETTITANCFDYKPSKEEVRQRVKPAPIRPYVPPQFQPQPQPRSEIMQPEIPPPIEPRYTLQQTLELIRKAAEEQEEHEKSQESDLGDMGYEQDMRRFAMKPREEILEYYEYTEVTKESLKIMLANWVKQSIDSSFKIKQEVWQYLTENKILLLPKQFKELLSQTFDPETIGSVKGFKLKKEFMRAQVYERVAAYLEDRKEEEAAKKRGKKGSKK